MTSNDLEMTFNSVFSIYRFGPSYCPLKIKKWNLLPLIIIDIILLYIFSRKSVQKKQFLNFFMKYDMKIFICFFCAITSTPNNTKPTLSGWAQGEDIILIKITPISAFIAKLCPIFEICDDLWPQKSKMAARFRKLDISLQRIFL